MAAALRAPGRPRAGAAAIPGLGAARRAQPGAGDAHRAHRRRDAPCAELFAAGGQARPLRLLRRADGRDRAPHRRGRAAPGQRAGGTGHARRRHGHLGTGPGHGSVALGRADVAAARAAASGTGLERGRAHGAGPPRRPRSHVAHPEPGRDRGPSVEPGVPCALARRAVALDRLACDRGARRARPVDPPHRRQLGHHRHAHGADRARREAARATREPGQVAVPVAHEPRAAHAAERGARFRAAAADRRRARHGRDAQAPAGADPWRRSAPAVADQRCARPVQPGRRRDPHQRAARAAAGAGGPDAAAGRAAGAATQGQAAQQRAGGRGAGRCHAPAPGAAEPADQCRQVQPRRRPGAGRGRSSGRRRAAARQRHRPWHERSAAAAGLRALQPAGAGERGHRRHRHRPGHRQGAGRAHGRHGARAQRTRPGQRVRGAAARRLGTRQRRSTAGLGERGGSGGARGRRASRGGCCTSRTTRSTC